MTARQHRQDHRVQQADEHRNQSVNDDPDHERRQAERTELGDGRVRERRHRDRREEIDRVPHASLHDEPVGERERGHDDAADDAALDAGRIRLDLDGHPRSMTTPTDAGALDGRAPWHDRRWAQLDRAQRDPFHSLLGKDLAPPAHASDQRQHDAHDADGGVGDETAEGQRDPEGQDHRPRRRCRQIDGVRRLRVSVVGRRHIRSNASSPRSSGR